MDSCRFSMLAIGQRHMHAREGLYFLSSLIINFENNAELECSSCQRTSRNILKEFPKSTYIQFSSFLSIFISAI